MGRVAYYYDADVGNFYYAQGHPMKPHRMRMTHNLLVAYGMVEKLDVLTPPRAVEKDMTRFHADDYIQFLKTVTPDSVAEHHALLSRFNVLEDCPVFDGLWEYCQIAAGGSLAGAARLNSSESDIAINWAGGLHHAKKAEASGFCYINDCVLAILELLKVHSRVLYIDIDIHHGDGVEEAFYSTDRVMTASFHKFGGFFPGTGAVDDVGTGRGKHYAVNFPLKDGIDDESYREMFLPVMSRIMEWYAPGAVVLQCGADSLTGDRLGCFNLSLRGHAQCVDFFKAYNVPLLLLGGGGYTIRNVARCWAYETSRVIDVELCDGLPFNDNLEFYAPEFRLHIVPSNMENHNTRAELEANKARILEHLRSLPAAPSVPIIDTPRASPLGVHLRDADSDGEDPDVRHRRQRSKMVLEYEDSDDELGTGGDDLLGNLPSARRRLKRPPSSTATLTAARKARSPSRAVSSAARDAHSPARVVASREPALPPFPPHVPLHRPVSMLVEPAPGGPAAMEVVRGASVAVGDGELTSHVPSAPPPTLTPAADEASPGAASAEGAADAADAPAAEPAAGDAAVAAKDGDAGDNLSSVAPTSNGVAGNDAAPAGGDEAPAKEDDSAKGAPAAATSPPPAATEGAAVAGRKEAATPARQDATAAGEAQASKGQQADAKTSTDGVAEAPARREDVVDGQDRVAGAGRQRQGEAGSAVEDENVASAGASAKGSDAATAGPAVCGVNAGAENDDVAMEDALAADVANEEGSAGVVATNSGEGADERAADGGKPGKGDEASAAEGANGSAAAKDGTVQVDSANVKESGSHDGAAGDGTPASKQADVADGSEGQPVAMEGVVEASAAAPAGDAPSSPPVDDKDDGSGAGGPSSSAKPAPALVAPPKPPARVIVPSLPGAPRLPLSAVPVVSPRDGADSLAGAPPAPGAPPVSPAPARKRWAPAGISAPPARRASGSPAAPPPGGAAPRPEPAPTLTPAGTAPTPAAPAGGSAPAASSAPPPPPPPPAAAATNGRGSATRGAGPAGAPAASSASGDNAGDAGGAPAAVAPSKADGAERAGSAAAAGGAGGGAVAPGGPPAASDAPADGRTVGKVKIKMPSGGKATASLHKAENSSGAAAAAADEDAK